MEKVITLEEALKRMKDYILENLMFRRLFVHDNRMFAERAFYCMSFNEHILGGYLYGKLKC